ncbi:MAG: hypothetical protein LW860_02460 [Xanthomonadaceae bacterium]|jgi:hypothetical protein|nr:hypothetical protein [Xanthomonadaceae bacterium]
MSEVARGSEIVVRLRGQAGAALSPSLELYRPREVVRVALGRPPREFLRILPLLFPLCGTAHAVAALRAIEDAGAVQVSPMQQLARRVVCLADALAAHAWRAEFDWPALSGDAGHPLRVAAARRATDGLVRALYPDADLLTPGGGRLAPAPGFAAHWSAALRDVSAALELDRHLASLQRAMPAAMAGADPGWLSRLQTRFRVVAAQARADAHALLGSLPALDGAQAPASPTVALDDGIGEGRVDTARGELAYRVVLRQGRVVDCALEAPIDRVFGTAGEAAGWLAALDRAARPQAAARWVVAALDPCAPVRVEQEALADA